jgi:hypothetical protein
MTMAETPAQEPVTIERLTPAKLDQLLLKYSEKDAEIEKLATQAKPIAAELRVLKEEIIAQVKAYGAKHAEKSKRLTGVRNTATITIGTSNIVDDDAVEKLKAFLEKQEIVGLREKLFTETVTYQLVDDPAEAVKKLNVGARMLSRIVILLALCSKPVPKVPSLKVEIVTPTPAK